MDKRNDEVQLKPLMNAAYVLLVVLIVTFIAVAVYMKWDGRNFTMIQAEVGPKQSDMPKDLQAFPNPRLQIRPQTDYKTFKEEQTKIVTSYGWVDKNKGIIRIPVEVAIDAVARKNLPFEEHKGE